MDDKPPLKGAWSRSYDPFLKFCPNHVFGIGETRHCRFRVLIEITFERDVFKVT